MLFMVSKGIPTLGGVVWVKYGHAWFFFAAAALALAMLFFTNRIRVPGAGGEVMGRQS